MSIQILIFIFGFNIFLGLAITPQKLKGTGTITLHLVYSIDNILRISYNNIYNLIYNRIYRLLDSIYRLLDTLYRIIHTFITPYIMIRTTYR
jgi:hypothetical protein